MNQMNVAIVGAGMAGARCAKLLGDAGHGVTVFDKSRGVGGRMATRRANWTCEGLAMSTALFDHGAPSWDMGSHAAFDTWAVQAQEAGVLQRWDARWWQQGAVRQRTCWLPTPDMPALCRWLLQGIKVHTESPVEALVRTGSGWRVQVAGAVGAPIFDAVVVAIPPAQATALWVPQQPLAPNYPQPTHPSDWPWAALEPMMQPCWTLMGITDEPVFGNRGSDRVFEITDHDGEGGAQGAHEWDVIEPLEGPLSCLIRQDAKPGRQAPSGHAAWVAHAHTDWTLQHLEFAAEKVLPLLQQAVTRVLGRADLRWHHAAVHRWRYAQAPAGTVVEAGFRWDASRGLGACGDYLGGGGVLGAWRSGELLANAITRGSVRVGG